MGWPLFSVITFRPCLHLMRIYSTFIPASWYDCDQTWWLSHNYMHVLIVLHLSEMHVNSSETLFSWKRAKKSWSASRRLQPTGEADPGSLNYCRSSIFLFPEKGRKVMHICSAPQKTSSNYNQNHGDTDPGSLRETTVLNCLKLTGLVLHFKATKPDEWPVLTWPAWALGNRVVACSRSGTSTFQGYWIGRDRYWILDLWNS